MPYSSINEIPDHVKKHPKKTQRRWLSIFNSVYRQTKSESRAFRAANSILKPKKKNLSKIDIDNIIKQYVSRKKIGKIMAEGE